LKDEDMKVGDDFYKGKSAGKVGTASTYRKNGSTGYCFWGNTGQFSAAYPVDPGTTTRAEGKGRKSRPSRLSNALVDTSATEMGTGEVAF
jgi:hypothetical protein